LQWFHQYYRCPASTEKAGLKVCTGKQQNGIHSTRSPAYDYPISLEEDTRALSNVTMRAEPDTPASCCDRNEEMGWKCDPDSCQRRIQNDETALSVDVGYYLDFDVDAATGRPRGCPSFESKANGGKLRNDKWKGSDVVDCEKNSYAPEGEPLHQIVEEFADNQEAWFKDFLTAFDKMSNNGYADGELVEGPSNWIGASCASKRVRGRGKVWTCTN